MYDPIKKRESRVSTSSAVRKHQGNPCQVLLDLNTFKISLNLPDTFKYAVIEDLGEA